MNCKALLISICVCGYSIGLWGQLGISTIGWGSEIVDEMVTCGSGYLSYQNLPEATTSLIWNITPLIGGGNPLEFTQDTIAFYSLEPGLYRITLRAFDADLEVIESDDMLFEAVYYPVAPYYIIGTNGSYESGPIDGECLKVCPGDIVTYWYMGLQLAYYNWPPGIQGGILLNSTFNPGGWNESYSFTVQWNEPGEGKLYFGEFALNGLTGNYLQEPLNTNDCTGVGLICVEIEGSTNVEIISDPPAQSDIIHICPGESVTFSDAVQESASIQWSFGNNQLTTDPSPTYTYTEEGTYEVVLRGWNETNCGNDMDRLTVEVSGADQLSLDCISTVCAGDTITYTVSPSCPQAEWAISPNGQVLEGGTIGAESVTVVWTNGVEGIIAVNAEDCALTFECGPNQVFSIPILSGEAAIVGPEIVCIRETQRYSLPAYEGTDYSWQVVGGTILGDDDRHFVDITWTNYTGTGRIIVHYESCFLGCSGTDTLFVRRLAPFFIEGVLSLCPNEPSSYRAKNEFGNSIACNWQLLDGAENIVLESSVASSIWTFEVPATAGQYTLTASPVDPNPTCESQEKIDLTVEMPPPTPDIFGPAISCPGTIQQYRALAIPGADVQWTIIKGDFSYVSNEKNIEVLWGLETPRFLLLRQRNSEESSCYSEMDTLEVITPAAATLQGMQDVCVEGITSYTAPIGNATDYEWRILPPDAGSIITVSQGDNIEVLWHRPGTATVQLKVCGSTLLQEIIVHDLVEATLLYDPEICSGTTTTVQTTELFSHYNWLNELGETVSTSSSPLLGPGNYQLIYANEWGCTQAQQFTIVGLPLPKVHISTPQLTSYCGQSAFNELYATVTESGLSYQWYHDGNPIGIDSSNIEATLLGDYQVAVTDENGCTGFSNKITLETNCNAPGTSSGSINLSGDPSIDFNIIPEADCMERSYELQTTVNTIAPNWLFNDPDSEENNTATGVMVTHRYIEPGFYPVLMYGLFTHPNYPSPFVGYIVKPDTAKLLADFSFEPNCVGQPMSFTDQSRFLSFTSIIEWQWDFGDPNSGPANFSSQADPTHIYDNPGTYLVELTVTESSGCTSTSVQEVNIAELPNPYFESPTGNCEFTAMRFSPQNIGNIVSAQWDFGDPSNEETNISSRIVTNHIYENAGDYVVTLAVTDIFGCQSTFSRTITIISNPLSGNIFPAQPEAVCQGDSVFLNAPLGGISWLWTNGATTEQIGATLPGQYSVTVTGADGCTYRPDPVQVDIFPAPPAEIVGVEYGNGNQVIGSHYGAMQICEGVGVALSTNGNYIDYSYEWSSGGTIYYLAFTEQRENLLEVGTYEFAVTVTDNETGCMSIAEPFTIEVVPNPEVPVLAVDSSAFVCSYEAQTFFVSNPEVGVLYLWSNGNDSVSISVAEPGAYTVTATNQYGCEAISDPIYKQLAPNMYQIPSGCHSVCRPAEICVSPINGIEAYQWYFNGVPISGATSPTLEAEEEGSYFLEAITADNCSYQSDVLELSFFEGIGNFTGQVYYDQNQNGIIDLEDSILTGVNILMELDTGLLSATTDTSGYAFLDIRAGIYNFQIDTTNLPPYSYAAIWQQEGIVGCDETTAVDWLVSCLPTGSSLIFEACSGDSVMFNNQFIQAGTEMEMTVANSRGCDSILQITVVELPLDTTSLTLATCPGGTIFFEGVPILEGTAEVIHFTNQNGCDSMVYVQVQALRQDTINLILPACANASAWYADTEIPAGAMASFIWQNSVGCDSTVLVNVLALPLDSSSFNIAICSGESYVYAGQNLEAGADEWILLQNQYGCDSMVHVQVETLRQDTVSLELSACANASAWYGNTEIPAGETASFMWQNSLGCDSMVLVNVQVLPLDSSSLSFEVCPGESVLYAGQNLEAGADAWFNLQNQQGCDSMVNVRVALFPETDYSISSEPSCPNENSGILVLQPQSGTPPFRFSLDGNTWQSETIFNDLAGGEYRLLIEDGNGCQTEEFVFVETLESLVVQLEDAILPCGQPTLNLSPNIFSGDDGQLSYRWNDGSVGPELTVPSPGQYALEISNSCETKAYEVEVRWEIKVLSDYFYLPNAFSPNDDGINDWFRVFPAEDVTVIEFKLLLFDRWGNQLYQSEDWQEGWDGHFRDRQLDPGIYVYYITTRVLVCGQEKNLEYAGDVALIN